MMPGAMPVSMRVPSRWVRIKGTEKLSEIHQPHRDGIHVRVLGNLRWYTLDELEPVTEEEYKAYVERLRQEARERNAKRKTKVRSVYPF